jgi:peptide/nickel transport system substrate-binding protein
MARHDKETGVLTRRELLQALGITGAVVAIAGCAPGTSAGPSPSGAASASLTPQRGGKLTLALSGNITTFDPRIAGTNNANRTPTHVFTNTMIRLNEDLQYVPELAESWTRSSDGLTWTLKLRKDVKFHDGSPFTSKDVKFTLESVMDPALKSPFLTSWVINKVNTKVMTPDDYTVVLQFPTEPSEPLYNIAFQRIVPMDYIQKVGNDAYAAKPIGTGPFKFVSYSSNDKAVFERNPDYWMKGLPYLDQFTFRIIPDGATRYAALQANEIQIAGLNPDDIVTALKDPDLTTYKYLFAGYHYVAFNQRDKLMADKRVRQALCYAIDSKEIIDAIVTGDIGHNCVAKNFPEYDPTAPKYTQDFNKVKSLLTEAGYPNGIDITINGLANLQPYTKVAEVVQNQFTKSGMIRAKLQLEDFTAGYVPRVFSPPYNFQMAIAAFTSVSALAAFTTYYGATKDHPENENFMGYANPELQRLYDEAKATRFSDQNKYTADMKALQKLIIDDAPAAFAGYWGTATTTRKNVVGFKGHPIQSYEYLESTWLKS